MSRPGVRPELKGVNENNCVAVKLVSATVAGISSPVTMSVLSV